MHDAVFADDSSTDSEVEDFHSADRRDWIVDQLLGDYLVESAFAG